MSKRAIVVGSSGFLGKALAFKLTDLGFQVTGVARRRNQELDKWGVNQVQLDIGEGNNNLSDIFSGSEVVFHTAAKVSMWGDPAEFERINVGGTERILESARKAGVPHLVYTSSPSVVASGADLSGVNESTPYPISYEAEYPRTKAYAERLVLSAHNNGIKTISLRPHLIFGRGDTNLIPKILERASQKRMIRIGNGKNLSDFCWIDDCVAAHIQAYEVLKTNPEIGGKPYFISQGDPVPLWWFVDRVLELNGMAKVTRSIPTCVAHLVAYGAELIARLKRDGKEPFLTRFLVSEMATNHYFDISAARDAFRYTPSCSVAQALEKTFGR